MQQGKIGQAAYRLKERDKVLFQTCIGALKNKNRERAAICANEISEVRKLVMFLQNVELAIERVILRLETIRELSEIVVDLKPALRLLQNVSQELFEILPDVSSELGKVNDVISETLYSTRITTDESIIPVGKKTEGGQEVLDEVSGFLERKLSETLPEPPTSLKTLKTEQATLTEMVALTANCSERTERHEEASEDNASQALFSFKKSQIQEISLKVENPQLEDVLLDYVRKSDGQIDLERCSSDLEASHEQITKALESLGSKGKIKVELRAGD